MNKSIQKLNRPGLIRLMELLILIFSGLRVNGQSHDSIFEFNTETNNAFSDYKIQRQDTVSNNVETQFNDTKKTITAKMPNPGSLHMQKEKATNAVNGVIDKIKYPNISIKGTFENQSYVTNAQNPFLKNSPIYSRFYFKPVVSIYGIPIRIDAFYTTETHGQYRNRYIQVSLDKSMLDANAKEKITETLKSKQREYSYKKMDLNLQQRAEAKTKEELTKVKNKYSDQKSLTKIAQLQLDKEKKKFMEQSEHIADSLKLVALDEKNNYQKSVLLKKDSIVYDRKNKLKSSQDSISDSLQNKRLYGRANKTIDSLQQNLDNCKSKEKKLQQQAESIQYKYDSIVEAYQKVKSLLDSDSLSIEKYKVMLEKPSPARLIKHIPGGIGEIEITKFAIGQVAPVYSEFGMNGIPVKGGELMLKSQKWFGGLAIGKTTNSNDFFSSENQKLIFNKRVEALLIGRQNKKNQYYLHLLNVAEDKRVDKQRNHDEKNIVVVTGTEMVIRKVIRVSAEVATSRYTLIPLNTIIEYKGDVPLQKPVLYKSLSELSAQKLNVEYDVTSSTLISIKHEKIGQGFKNLGNPFMRHDFMIREIKVNQAFLANKIRLEVFYKEGSDNVNKERDYTNKNKGLGFKGRTAFKKYPNLMVMYSPFQFGNNHPDTALRTSNQINFTMIAITWFKTFKKIKTGSILNYSHSQQSFSNMPEVSVTTYSFSENLGITKNLQVNFQTTYSKTFPSVDSVNCFSQSAGIFHSPNSKNTWNLTIENISYFNNGYKRGSTLGGSLLLKNNSCLNLQVGLSHIHKIWGRDDALVFFTRFGLIWKW